MEIILRAVIVGDGTTSKNGMVKKSGDNGRSNDGGIIGGDFRDFNKRRFSFKKNMECRGVLAGDHGVGFPMTELRALIDEMGSFWSMLMRLGIERV